jgi:tRNA A37 threonylcarbamoyladenosine dehydratase
LGGVGSWAAEALVRSGIGHITIVDNDVVSASNINRQAEALTSTVGVPKAAALMRQLLDINPACDVKAFNQVFSRETANLFDLEHADYVIDAIDTLPNKIDLIEMVLAAGGGGEPGADGEREPDVVVLFSSMGMAQKIDPTKIKTADIWNSGGCPLARIVRQNLRKRAIDKHFTVVYSNEQFPRVKEVTFAPDLSGKKIINGSMVTVTAAAGMILASLVIGDVIDKQKNAASGGLPNG